MKKIISNINFIKVFVNLNILTLSSMIAISGMSNTYAQSETITEKPIPWYQIELIIFEYTNTKNVETEVWQPQPGNPEQDLSLELMDSKTMLEQSIIPDPYLLLDPEEFQLTQEYNLLRSSRQRNPLLHLAWRQPANSKDESIPIRIHGGKLYSIQPEYNETPMPDTSLGFGDFLGDILGSENIETQTDEPEDNDPETSKELLEQIEGTIRISRARYLHVWTDLIYRIPSTNIESISYSRNSYESNTDFDSINTNQTTYNQPFADFRLQDHRRMRSKELHYIDHPLFGIIVKAMPYALPEIPDEEPPAEETSPQLKTGKIKKYY